MVKVACQACRLRKTKCDAKRPRCSPCVARGKRCEYDSEPDIDRYTSLKRKHGRLEKEHDDLVELFDMLQFRARRDAVSILDRVRTTDTLHSTLAFIKQGDLLMQNRARSLSISIIGVVPRDASPTETLLNIFHPLVYPTLLPLDDADAGLGYRRKSILTGAASDGSSLVQDDIDGARLETACLPLYRRRDGAWTGRRLTDNRSQGCFTTAQVARREATTSQGQQVDERHGRGRGRGEPRLAVRLVGACHGAHL